MAKRPSKHLREPRPLVTRFAAVQAKADGQWMVQTMRPENAAKTYRCPGCDRPVPPGEGHVVVWPVRPAIGSSSAVADRRHWHAACWKLRH